MNVYCPVGGVIIQAYLDYRCQRAHDGHVCRRCGEAGKGGERRLIGGKKALPMMECWRKDE